MVNMIKDLALHHLDPRIDHVTGEIETLAGDDEACQRLMTVPGIGPIIASAMVATIGDGSAFRRGRDFGAWLWRDAGLVASKSTATMNFSYRWVSFMLSMRAGSIVKADQPWYPE
jgi:Transposase IS116/IS110/IS902 family